MDKLKTVVNKNPAISLLGLYAFLSLRSFAENEIGCPSLVLEDNL